MPSLQVAVEVHTPEAQEDPSGQRTPHAPQLRGSVLRLASQPPVPSQLAYPAAHTQLPFEQVPLVQMLPQAPQLLGSVLVLMHCPLQRVCPEPQPQVPLVQTPLVQALPQVPQWLGSVLGLTH